MARDNRARASWVIGTATAFAIVLAGCGDDKAGNSKSNAGKTAGNQSATQPVKSDVKRLSKKQYIAKADAACVAATRALTKVGQPKTPEEIPRFVDGAISVYQKVFLAQISRVSPPAADQAAVDAWLDSNAAGIELFKQMKQALAAKDTAKFQSLTTRTSAVAARTTKLARAYGMRGCGSEPSSKRTKR